MTLERLEMIRKFFSGFEGKASPARVGMAQGLALELVAALTPQPINKTTPRGRYLLVFGDSGYVTTDYRVEVCRHDAEFRPRSPWVNHANDAFTDGGPAPTLWMELPPLPPLVKPGGVVEFAGPDGPPVGLEGLSPKGYLGRDEV